MTPEVVEGITARYMELYEAITGEKFEKKEYTAEAVEKDIRDYLQGK